MMPGPELLDRVVAEATRQHRPEGVSVMVKFPRGVRPDPELARSAAWALAHDQYPSVKLTGRFLAVLPDELGPRQWEVVLEVA